MDDLISRQEVIDRLSEVLSSEGEFERAKEAIFEAPTTYNVDKIVKEIEEVLQDLNVLEIMCHFDSDSAIQSDLDNFLQAIKNEIMRRLKAGGVNG